MARVLVTGIEGFTGYYLARALLEKGHTVHGIGLQENLALECPVDYRKGDLLDAEGLARLVEDIQPDWVFHLAGVSHVISSPDLIYRVNVGGTRNLLSSLATKAQPGFVLLASSANIYGNAGGVLDENTPPSPCNDYAVSKYAMELMAKIWSAKLPITIVRPFNYTGKGQDENFVIPKIVKHFREKWPKLELGNMTVTREFNDVRDVTDIYISLAENKAGWGPFNICSGRGYTLTEILSALGSMTGFCPEISVNAAFVRENEVSTLVGDASRLKTVIGHGLQKTISETLGWMLHD